MRLPLVAVVAGIATLPTVLSGPIAYALCQTACNAGAIACYAAAGFTFGATLGASAPPAIITCNAIQGTCMAACVALLAAPTP